MAKRLNFSDKIKAAVALEAPRGDKMVSEIAAKRQLQPTQVSTWKRQAIEHCPATPDCRDEREHGRGVFGQDREG